jgi:hypothetical protein
VMDLQAAEEGEVAFFTFVVGDVMEE